MLIYPSRGAVALRWVVDNLSETAPSFPLKFRLLSGQEAGTRPAQPAALCTASASLNSAGSHQMASAVVLSPSSADPSSRWLLAKAPCCRTIPQHSPPASAVLHIHHSLPPPRLAMEASSIASGHGMSAGLSPPPTVSTDWGEGADCCLLLP